MRDVMEKVSRCQMHFPVGLLGDLTVITFKPITQILWYA